MFSIKNIDTTSKQQVNQFINFPFNLYKNCQQWVPPIRSDVRMMLDRKKHPFYEHSDADFFMVMNDEEIVGRMAVLENRPFNKAHDTKQAFFTLVDFIEDQSVVNMLFEQCFEWARKRNLNRLVGSKGIGPFDGYGILVKGFEHRQMMTMMAYNYPYYPEMIEKLGFKKEVDFVSCYLKQENFHLSDKVREVAHRAKLRGTFVVKNFTTKRDLKNWAWRIGEAYNKTFVNNWEYYPLSEREVEFVLNDLLTIADPRLIKIITYKENVVGFLFGFPDASAALQRSNGRLNPLSIIDLMIDSRRAKWITFNGTGVLPEFHGRGGNALMYYEMEKTIHDYQFKYVDMPQVAETAVQMRQDLKNLGGVEYKNHRVYYRDL